MTPTSPKMLPRAHEITEAFHQELDKHLSDIIEGRERRMFEIRDFAALLHIHPTHLTNTIKHATGRTPCDFYENRILEISKDLLTESTLPINEIAFMLTYDPSNFTKFFKRFSGLTPKQYREQSRGPAAPTPNQRPAAAASTRRKTVTVTI